MRGSPFSSFTRRLAWPSRAPARTPLGAALLVMVPVASPARADDIPPQFLAQYEATRDYLQLLQQADADNAPEQLDSPRAMQLLAAVTNKTDVLAPDYATADLGLLTNACQRQPVRDALKETLEQVDPSDVPLLQQAIAGFSSEHCGTLCQS